MKEQWGRIIACGCVLHYERCIDCRAGLDLDQEKAIAITEARWRREALPPKEGDDE